MIVTDIAQLKLKSSEASEDEVKLILKELETALDISEKAGAPGIGLAAPQIGIHKRVAIIRIGNIKIDLVNCTIGQVYDKTISYEGCLSLPGKECKVQRSNQIVISDNVMGSHISFCAYGMAGICIQHEMDHWDGILMIDRAIEEQPNIGPNQPCVCGKLDENGKPIKYKKCCGRKK